VCLATEDEFVSTGKQLSEEEKDIQKDIFGMCLFLLCVQTCQPHKISEQKKVVA